LPQCAFERRWPGSTGQHFHGSGEANGKGAWPAMPEQITLKRSVHNTPSQQWQQLLCTIMDHF